MASKDSFMFTVGKVDAGMAILIGERAHLIEFPSILLPSGCTSGSIVNISVHRELAEERKQKTDFWNLQDRILQTFGVETPEPPRLELRNVTQTAVTLEWPALNLATSKLRSLDIYRNGQRLATIPSPLQNTSSKLSGLQLDSDYTFQLILRTTAGTFPSNILKVRTHKMTNTSGISVCFGDVTDFSLLEDAKAALKEMGAKWSDKIQIDTTHFVCDTPAAAGDGGAHNPAPGVEYQRALQLSIPVVQPQWIFACHQEKRMVQIANYYLGTSSPSSSSTYKRPGSMSQINVPSSKDSSDHPGAKSPASYRQSLPATASGGKTSPFVNQSPELEQGTRSPGGESTSSNSSGKNAVSRGKMNKEFKFPLTNSEVPPLPPVEELERPIPDASPSPIEKDAVEDDDTGEVGETEEVDLS